MNEPVSDADLAAPAIARLVRNRRDQREPFTHAISLGTSCYPAWLLKTLGLKRASYPFDWIFSSADMVRAMLEDRFATFLDPAHFDPEPAANRTGRHGVPCNHRGYRERFGVDNVFNHHDPSDPRTLAYFERGAARFLDVTGGPDKVLLLMIQTGPPTEPADFARLCAAVDGLGPRNTLICINVGRTGDTLNMGMRDPHQIGRHRMRTYRSTSHIEELRFTNPIDEFVLRGVVMQFRFDPDAA